jgi:cold shock CspA family protein
MARVHGTLNKWNDERGFGFITLPQGGKELFVHVSAFPRDGSRPEIGELMSFELEVGSDGKQRAIRVQRGQRAQRAMARPYRPATRTSRLPGVLALSAVCLVLAYLVAPLAKFAPHEAASVQDAPPLALDAPASFTCDGRTSCTQMHSCAEATYFLRNCPGTKMDGDDDGIPCERQWCQ